MAQLIVIYDPRDMVSSPKLEMARALGIKEAKLSIAGDTDLHKIKETAQRLAELLLEQL